MAYCNPKDTNRFITGTVIDCDNNCVPNTVVVLSAKYSDCCGNEYIDKIAYSSTNNCGEFVFCIDISKCRKVDFIIEAFYPFKYCY